MKITIAKNTVKNVHIFKYLRKCFAYIVDQNSENVDNKRYLNIQISANVWLRLGTMSMVCVAAFKYWPRLGHVKFANIFLPFSKVLGIFLDYSWLEDLQIMAFMAY